MNTSVAERRPTGLVPSYVAGRVPVAWPAIGPTALFYPSVSSAVRDLND